METALLTNTTAVLSVDNIDSTAIRSFRYMGNQQQGTLEVSFQSGGVYQYREVPYIKVLTMASWVNGGESLGNYFHRFIRTAFPYSRLS
jgi:hypothetical protein